MSKEGKKKSTPTKKKAKKAPSEASPKSRKDTASPVPGDTFSPRKTPGPVTASPLQEQTHLHVLCFTHTKPYIAYSSGRETLVCEECLAGKEALFYPIVGIEDAFRRKIGQLYGQLNASVYAKKQTIETKIKALECRMDEIKGVKTLIERDMKSELSAMQDRLTTTMGHKEAEIEHILGDFHGDLERIAAIIDQMDSVSTDQVAFLLRHRDLRDMCEVALAKPVIAAVVVVDPPRELSETRELIDSSDAVCSLIEFKNEVIYRLSRPDRPCAAPPSEEEEELKEWIRLAERYSEEVAMLRLQCDYCRCLLAEDTVNARCSVTKDAHFFVKADPHLSEVRFPDYVPPAPSELRALAPLELVRALASERKVDIDALMRRNDALSTGVLPPSEFQRVLVSGVGLQPAAAAELATQYDLTKSGRVQYPLFLSDLLSPLFALFDRLRGKASVLKDCFAGLDLRQCGLLTLDRFREALRRAGVVQKDISFAVEIVDVGDKGEVDVGEFLRRVKVGK